MRKKLNIFCIFILLLLVTGIWLFQYKTNSNLKPAEMVSSDKDSNEDLITRLRMAAANQNAIGEQLYKEASNLMGLKRSDLNKSQLELIDSLMSKHSATILDINKLQLDLAKYIESNPNNGYEQALIKMKEAKVTAGLEETLDQLQRNHIGSALRSTMDWSKFFLKLADQVEAINH